MATTKNLTVRANKITIDSLDQSYTDIKGDGLVIDNKAYLNDEVVFNGNTISFETDKVSKLQFMNSNGVDKAVLKYENAHLELKSNENTFTETFKTETVKATNFDVLNEDASLPKLRLKADSTGEILNIMDNAGGDFKNVNAHQVYATSLLLKENSTDTTGFYFVRNGQSVILKNTSGTTIFTLSQ
jgi:hypothetical protein